MSVACASFTDVSDDSISEDDMALDEDRAQPTQESEPLAESLAEEELKGSDPGATNLGSSIEQVELTDIRYVSRAGGGTVVIETTGVAVFRTREIPSQNQVVIDIANSRLPDRLRRPYITREFGQAVASVHAYQSPGASTSRVVISFKSPMRAAVTQSGRRLLVLATRPAKLNPQAADGMAAIDSDDLDDASELNQIAVSASAGGAGDSRIFPETQMGTEGVTAFYGKPISLEVSKTPVRDVISLIAEQSGANIVLSSEVSGDMTLKLRQIPWDQALMVVMKSNNLGYVRQGSILRIAPLADLQKEAEGVRKMLEAQKDAEPLKVKMISVSYASVEDLATRLKPFLTKRGQVQPDIRTSTLVLTDTAEVLERAQTLVKALDTPPLQVLIEGKVVEATEGFSRDFGVKWGLKGKEVAFGNLAIQKNNLAITPGLKAGALNYDFRFGTLDVFGDLDASLSLAEQENQIRIVSSPRVVTMNNKEATISQTTNIFFAAPAQTAANGTQQAVTYQQQSVPLTLRVKPQVTNDGDVIMDVSLTRSFAGVRSGNSPPDVNQRSANTNVMVRNGQTAVIGGVYQSDISEGDTGVPWLRNVPVLGWLFKSRSYTSTKNELLLFLTPRIINPEKSGAQTGTF